MRTNKLIASLAVAALVATGCEEALNPASDAIEPGSVENPTPRVERVVDEDEASSETPSALPTPVLEAEGLTLIHAPARNAAATDDLDGAVIGDPFEVRLEVSDVEIDRVEWFIDGMKFRDDDIHAPYNLRYVGVLPIGMEFDSDQGFANSWTFDEGQVYLIEAIVHRGATSLTVAAFFEVRDDELPVPSTTVPAPPTTASPTTAPPATTTTAAPVTTTTTAPPTTTTTPVATDGRPIVMADANTVLDQPNTIYDFNFSSPGEVVILASNIEARNIRGGGARRVGDSDGRSVSDSGFRDFEFTFANIRVGNGGTVTRPYFIDGTDVNAQPNVGDGDIIQIFAYEGDIISPLIDNVTVYGKKLPAGSSAHNDGIQFTGISGGEVWNPTIRNSHVEGASSAGVQAKHVHGVFTFENNTLSERFQSYHAVIAKPGDNNAQVLWRNNTLVDGASAAFTEGWDSHPDTIWQDGLTIK